MYIYIYIYVCVQILCSPSYIVGGRRAQWGCGGGTLLRSCCCLAARCRQPVNAMSVTQTGKRGCAPCVSQERTRTSSGQDRACHAPQTVCPTLAAHTRATASAGKGTQESPPPVHQRRARTLLALFRTSGVPKFFARISSILHRGTTVAHLGKYVNCVGVRVLVLFIALRLSR